MTKPPRVLRFPTAAALTFALVCSSCGDGRKPVFPVRGQVLYEGKPTPDALVIFHPLNDSDPNALRPLGRVAADGSFTLTTYRSGDGAPAGEYAVTVTWQKEGDRQNDPVEERREEPNRLPDRYSKPATSGLRVEITKGSNELAPFRLTKK